MSNIIVKFVLCHKTHTCYCWSLLLLSPTHHHVQNLVAETGLWATVFSEQYCSMQYSGNDGSQEGKGWANSVLMPPHFSTHPEYNPIYTSPALHFTFNLIRKNWNFQLELTSLSGCFCSGIILICFKSNTTPFTYQGAVTGPTCSGCPDKFKKELCISLVFTNLPCTSVYMTLSVTLRSTCKMV